MNKSIILAEERLKNETGKKVRKLGKVPGIIYGEFLETNIPVKMDEPSLLKLLNANSDGSIIQLKVNDCMKRCVVKKVEKDCVTNKIMHVEFQYVKENEVIKLRLPVKFVGHENLALKRLVLENNLNDIELQGPVEKIPEYLEIDVSSLEYNDKIFVKDIKLPDDIKLITNPDTLVALVN
ncbi:50S ribosomal protein L25 [Clostridium ihumii]|uniref:50S ribosomal protein L25 n=1 Tax=Clostridium ihumii TaxID=1470356 RepID=UPI00058FC778|nr:50S ribosomal protein L25 [Clostridium ihumii]